MPLDPQAQTICDAVNAMGGAPASDEELQAARDGLAMLHAGGGGEPEDVYAVGDLDADGVPVRVYRPSAEDNLPVVVYFHGGGWTIGSVDVYDAIDALARERRARDRRVGRVPLGTRAPVSRAARRLLDRVRSG